MLICFCALASRQPRLSAAFQDEAIPVEPGDLAKREDLIGKKVALDDHVALLREPAPATTPMSCN